MCTIFFRVLKKGVELLLFARQCPLGPDASKFQQEDQSVTEKTAEGKLLHQLRHRHGLGQRKMLLK